MMRTEHRLHPHVLVWVPLTDVWVCECGRMLTSEWIVLTLDRGLGAQFGPSCRARTQRIEGGWRRGARFLRSLTGRVARIVRAL